MLKAGERRKSLLVTDYWLLITGRTGRGDEIWGMEKGEKQLKKYQKFLSYNRDFTVHRL